MKETHLQTIQWMHSQTRNRHSKMFGGYVMRLGIELGVKKNCGITVQNVSPRVQKSRIIIYF